jgi:N-acetylneuraminate lyase/4-hydroxy-tetrahydrodipicolinate synthase
VLQRKLRRRFAMKEFSGIIPPLIIPFNKEGGINEASLREFIDFLIERKIGGLFPCGTFGSGPLMSIDERKKCAEIIIDATAGRIPVIIHVGTTTTALAVEFAQHAEKAGADAVSAVPPYYYPHIEEVVTGYYQRLVDSVSIPVFAYNNPGRVGYGISAKLMGHLADMGIAGVKESSYDLKVLVSYLNSVKKPGFQFIMGTVPLLYPGLMMGAIGGVAGTANVFPEIVVELFNEFKKGNYSRCVELQKKNSRLVEIMRTGGVPIASLIAMYELRGYEFGYPHDPMIKAAADTKEKIKQELLELGLL